MKRILLNYSFLIILLLTLGACGNSADERLLAEDNNQKDITNTIIFGEKTGDTSIKARNLFEIGEETHFLVTAEDEFGIEQVLITLNKAKDEKWSKITESELEVHPDAKQFMNGFPGSTFETLGTGAYQLKVTIDKDRTLTGEFIIEEKGD
ncbi:hypothetical protein [Aquibacillus albus]|uniref:Intracellular proteinase inhibitor BsuPI domain-containing protein n=1 Tax=Aquibacillus albus TaxID=1168171 RepID=A0ABS2N000_9BACI|nr:hypothetical protein [Aquibacillus albus]MBM7571368.1 hypothetical protein [Aquibacillus albus]